MTADWANRINFCAVVSFKRIITEEMKKEEAKVTTNGSPLYTNEHSSIFLPFILNKTNEWKSQKTPPEREEIEMQATFINYTRFDDGKK